jgi:hypothetical protein
MKSSRHHFLISEEKPTQCCPKTSIGHTAYLKEEKGEERDEIHHIRVKPRSIHEDG